MPRQKSAEIIGKTVVNQGGFVLGEVVEYLVDLDSWRVCDLQVRIDRKRAKELGLKTPFFGNLLVLIGTDVITSVTDQVIIGLDANSFADYIAARAERGGDEE